MSNTSPLLEPQLLARLERLQLASRKVFRGRMKGERKSPRKGQSVQFADFRNYVPGDDVRFIDWNTYARLERLFLKMFLEEEDLHIYLLLDTSRSMEFGEPSKGRFAAMLAAALGFIGLVRGDRVKIETLAAATSAPAFRGRRSLAALLGYLEGLSTSPPISLAEGVKRFCLRNTSAGVVVLVSDLLDKGGYEEAMRRLVARNFDVYIVHVLAPEEIDPDLHGDVRLVDCEDGDTAEVTAGPAVMRRYRQKLQAWRSEVRQYCLRRGIGYAAASSAMRTEDVISGLLRQQGLVG